MRNKNIRLTLSQLFINGIKNCRAVSARQSAAPHAAFSYLADKQTRRREQRKIRRHPNLTAENTAQTRNLYAANILYTAVEIVSGKRRTPKPIVNKIGIRLVIARNPVNLCLGITDRFENHIQRLRRREIAEDQHRIRMPLIDRAQYVRKLAVRVPAQKYLTHSCSSRIIREEQSSSGFSPNE